MSNFEYLVGTESDFNGSVDDCTIKIWHDLLGPLFCTESTIPYKKGVSIIAMRRIIQEPKRWTVADQKAGRLPEVGVIGALSNGRKIEYLGKSVGGALHHVRFIDDCECVRINILEFKPIETPEEKSERLRGEWVELAFDNMMRKEGLHSTECLDRMKIHFSSAYDALLSGTLSVPTKGGE